MRPRARTLAMLPILMIVLAACSGTQGAPIASPPQSPTASDGGSTPPPTPSPEPSEEPIGTPVETPSPSAPAEPPSPAIAVDSIVRTTVSGLRLREDPTTGATSPGTLALGAQSYVVDGPVSADGYTWYLLSGLGLPLFSGCTGPQPTNPLSCPVWFGWAAAASPDGEAWLETDDVDCPAWPENVTAEITYGIQRIAFVACFGDEQRTLTGFYPLIPDDAGLGGACAGVPDGLSWIACNLGYEHIGMTAATPFGDGFMFSVDPTVVTMPERGQWIRLTGRFDHPAADACSFGDEPARTALHCRAQFVVESAEAVAAP